MDNAPPRQILAPPGGARKVLLHSLLRALFRRGDGGDDRSGLEYTIFFYNPNIHPRTEYELRKAENIRFAEKEGVPFVDADYDTDNWFARAKGLEWAPERGGSPCPARR